MPFRHDTPRFVLRVALAAAMLASVAGCGEVVLTDGRSLTRQDRLSGSDAVASDSRLFVDQAALSRTRTVRIIPTSFPADAVGASVLTPEQRALAANAADRAMCYELSLKYDVVSTPDADLTVRSRITRVDPTDLLGAGSTIGLSAAISIAGQLGVSAAEGLGRIPVPRIPIGLGSLTVEAEAVDRHRQQRAAMIWGGAANSFTSQPRFSKDSDAYDLAGEFGQDFGFFIATGKDPFKSELFIPNWNRIRITMLGEAPLDPDCARYGRAPGLDGILTDYIGLPPEYGDKGTAGRSE
jgi:hypothetical protein